MSTRGLANQRHVSQMQSGVAECIHADSWRRDWVSMHFELVCIWRFTAALHVSVKLFCSTAVSQEVSKTSQILKTLLMIATYCRRRNEGWLLSEWVLVILLMYTRIHYWTRVWRCWWCWSRGCEFPETRQCSPCIYWHRYLRIDIREWFLHSMFRYWWSELKYVFQRILSESFRWSNKSSTCAHCRCLLLPFLQCAQCSHCKRCISYSNSVRPSVCLSVTRRYCLKTTARSTVQFAPLDSKMSLVL